MQKTWKAPVLEELSIPGGTLGGTPGDDYTGTAPGDDFLS
jgi:hypothetical protein